MLGVGVGGKPKMMYRVARSAHVIPPNYLTESPCGLCPVASRCCEGGVISPSTCLYMNNWLAANSEEGGGDGAGAGSSGAGSSGLGGNGFNPRDW
jgi:RNA polymerase Rpc34 subunit